MIRFEINKRVGRINLAPILKKLEKIIFKEFKKSGIISVAFIDSDKMKEYNKKYRRKNKSTDILTFVLNPVRSRTPRGGRSCASAGGASNGVNDGEILGEIILSSAEIKKRAKSAGRGLLEATIYLIIHGVCHIFGHTHQGKNDTKNMEAKERKIFNYVYKSVI